MAEVTSDEKRITQELERLREALSKLDPTPANAPSQHFGSELFATLLDEPNPSWSDMRTLLAVRWRAFARDRDEIPAGDVVASGVGVLHALWEKIESVQGGSECLGLW